MPTIKTTVQNQFGAVAERYRTSSVHAAGLDLELIVQRVAEFSAPDVLDIGCGAGHVSVAVAPRSRQVVACDLTPHMLDQVQQLARERGVTNLRTQLGDVERLPFPERSFDLVIARYTAHHWPHPTTALRECLRVIKPGGRMLLSDVVAPAAPLLDTFLQTIEFIRDHSHVRDHSIAQWRAIGEQLGCSVTLMATWDIPLAFQPWVERMATPPAQVAMLQHLFQIAPDEARDLFRIGEDAFTLPAALFELTPPTNR